MTKTYYMVTTTDSHNRTKVIGLAKDMKKIKPLYFKLIDDKSDNTTIVMYRLTCDVANGEIRYKECVQWYKPEQHQAN